MSVSTTADEALDKADENIREAISCLNKIVVERCWGHDEYREEYAQAIHESLIDLIKVAVRLNR